MDTISTVPVVLPNKTRERVEATPIRLEGDSDVSFAFERLRGIVSMGILRPYQ